MLLPMRSGKTHIPDISISRTRDISIVGECDQASSTALKLERFVAQFVDIGAGLPEGSPLIVPRHQWSGLSKGIIGGQSARVTPVRGKVSLRKKPRRFRPNAAEGLADAAFWLPAARGQCYF
jgi:hypothetical protein